MTRKDIMCEPGAERIAFRSTQGTGRHLKARWTELEVWFRHEANGRPPFVTVVAGRSSVPGEDQRETVQEAATLRIAGTHFMRDTLPAQAVRDEANDWWRAHQVDAAVPTYSEAQREAAAHQIRLARHGTVLTEYDIRTADLVAAALGLTLEMPRG